MIAERRETSRVVREAVRKFHYQRGLHLWGPIARSGGRVN